ncbi:MAG: nickel insertion protein, partial [Gemmatimonadales bacterium]
MSAPRFAILDPAAGISGDMLLGALVAAGAPEDWLRGVPTRLGFPHVSIGIQRVDRCGLQATKVDVLLPGGVKEEPGDIEHGHHHDHHHHHPENGHHEHRHLAELLDIVARAPLSPWVKERALATFRALGAAESRVHGVA